jgi:acetyl-CoA decarbonylase/synthase complex subunit delta
VNAMSEPSCVKTVAIGALRAHGGTRSQVIRVGGGASLPIASEPPSGLRPALALELWDVVPEDFPTPLKEAFDGSVEDPASWAQRCESCGPDLICLRLVGTHSEMGDRPPHEAAETAREVAQTTRLPLLVVGCDQPQKDADVMTAVCEALEGERCLIGCAVHENYRTFAAAAAASGHSLIAESPIDLNLAKQLNILLGEAGFDTGRIVIHHLTSALGYGFEYTYSIMERSRLAALSGDEFLSQPTLVFVGKESWRVKECTSPAEEVLGWGRLDRRGTAWEVTSAVAYLCAGADIVVLSHPKSLAAVRSFLDLYWRDRGDASACEDGAD